MKKTLQRVLAVVLSLVMVAGLVAIDSSAALAAKKLKKVSTGKKTVYSGQSRTFKISGTNAKKAKWTVSGTGKKYVKITGKKTGKTFKFKVKANATGKAKITAKLTKKNKVSYTYNLKCKATSMSLSNQDIYTNDVVTLTPAFVPSNAVAPAGEAVYEVFSDADCAVKATTFVVTPSGISAEFTATAPGTYYVKATIEGFNAVAAITVTDKVAKLTSVHQTKKNELVLTVDAADPKLTPETLYIRDVNEQRFYVNSITADKADATKLTVVTLNNMVNGKELTVTYEGSSLTFTASTGVVSEIEVTPTQAPYDIPVEVYAITRDVSGVELDKVKYGSSNSKFTNFDIVFRNGKGATEPGNGTITFTEKDEVADVAIKYDMGINATTNETEYKDVAATIVSVEKAPITGVEAVMYYNHGNYVEKEDSNGTYTKLMENRKPYMQDYVRAEAGSVYLAALIKDSAGYTRVDGSLTEAGYVLSSSDNTVLIVEGDEVVGVKGGSAAIIASDDKGEVQFTIPVKVQDAARLKTISLSKSVVELTTGNKAEAYQRMASPAAVAAAAFLEDSTSVTVTGKDQYGNDYGSFTIEVEDNSDKNVKDVMDVHKDSAEGTHCSGGSQSISCSVIKHDDSIASDRAIRWASEGKDDKAPYIKRGSYQENVYKVTVTDKNDDGNKQSKIMNVRVKQPNLPKKLQVELSTASVDTTVKETTHSMGNQNVVVRLAMTDSSGVFVGYVPLPSMSSITINRGTTEYVKDATSRASLTAPVTESGLVLYDGKITSNGSVAAGGDRIVPFVTQNNGAPSQANLSSKVVFVASALADTVRDSNVIGYSALPTKNTWKIVNKADTGNYTVTVKNVKFDKDYGALYDQDKAPALSATFSVKDSQGTVSVTQDYNTTSLGIKKPVDGEVTEEEAAEAASAIALNTLRFTATDAVDYIYNKDKDEDETEGTYRVGFRVVGSNRGYSCTNEEKITFTRLVVLVPYRWCGNDIWYADKGNQGTTWNREDGEIIEGAPAGGVYVPMTVNANYAVTAE